MGVSFGSIYLLFSGDYVHVVAGGNSRPPPLNDSPEVEMMGLGNPQNRVVTSENWLTDSNEVQWNLLTRSPLDNKISVVATRWSYKVFKEGN